MRLFYSKNLYQLFLIFNGQFTLKAPKETTEHFPDVLEYDVKLIDPDGNEEFYEEGRINVSEGYTR